jgi:hypothetical protein
MAPNFASMLMGPSKPSSVSIEIESGEERDPTAEEIVAAAAQISALKSGDAKALAKANYDAYLVVKACCEGESGAMEMGDD